MPKFSWRLYGTRRTTRTKRKTREHKNQMFQIMRFYIK